MFIQDFPFYDINQKIIPTVADKQLHVNDDEAIFDWKSITNCFFTAFFCSCSPSGKYFHDNSMNSWVCERQCKTSTGTKLFSIAKKSFENLKWMSIFWWIFMLMKKRKNTGSDLGLDSKKGIGFSQVFLILSK